MTYVATEILHHPCTPFYTNLKFILFLAITFLALNLFSIHIYIKCENTQIRSRPRILTSIIPSDPLLTPPPYRHLLQQIGLPVPEEPSTVTEPPVPAALTYIITRPRIDRHI